MSPAGDDAGCMRTDDVTRAVLQEQDVAVVCGHADVAQIATFLGGAFGEVMTAVEQQGRRVVGMPFSRYHPTGDDEFDIEAGFPVDAPVTGQGRVEASTLPGGPVALVVHHGSYDTLGAAYDAAIADIEKSGERVSGDPWECYLDGPEVPEPRTEVFVPYSGRTAD